MPAMRVLLTTLVVVMSHIVAEAGQPGVLGYIGHLPTESAADAVERHKRVAERRAGPMIIVHRGAWAFAPENTLEAYAAALDYGADGFEVDIRRSADGVLFVFHDNLLQRCTHGFGQASALTYYELLSCRLRTYGTATRQTRVPTFAAVLELARRRAAVLELDIKGPGIENDIGAMIDAADAWDHVVYIDEWNSTTLRVNPKYQMLQMVGYLPDGRRDMVPEIVRTHIPPPGSVVVVDDPRLIVHEMGRPPHQPVPIPSSLRQLWHPTTVGDAANDGAFGALHWLPPRLTGTDRSSQLVELMKTDRHIRSDLSGDDEYQAQRGRRILDRAWAAHQLGQMKAKSARVVRWLEHQVRRPSLHQNGLVNGMDGVMAVQSLGEIAAIQSVGLLVRRVKASPSYLSKLSPERSEDQVAVVWGERRLKRSIIEVLGRLPCGESKALLLDDLILNEAVTSEYDHWFFALIAKALTYHELTQSELECLMQDERPEVRGTIIQYCLDHPSRAGDAALQNIAPWALRLPRAAHK